MIFLQRILCDTVKDFVAKIEKSHEKTLENAVVAEAVASKVRGTGLGHQFFFFPLTNLRLICILWTNEFVFLLTHHPSRVCYI